MEATKTAAPAAAEQTKKKKKKISPYMVFSTIVIILLAIAFAFPLYWILTGSFKTQISINSTTPEWWPSEWVMTNYDKLFSRQKSPLWEFAAAAAAIANHKPAEKLVGTLKVKKQPMPLIAVPTTAGTGSETTIAAVISGTATHRKRQILDPKLVPFAAILDPELTVGLPQGNTIHTAMDALTHALEAYVSTYATPETDRYAEMAAKMIYEALPVVREEPKNVEMREQLMVASFLAGMAFTRTYVGYVHAFAHSIGGRYGVAHGLANAVLLPHIMEYYLPVSTPRLARMAQICGISGDSDESTRARAFVESIAAMNQTSGVPERLAEFPRAEIDAVIKEAFQECHGTYPVPRYYTRPAARALLEQVCAE